MELFLDDDIVREIVVGQLGWRSRRSGHCIHNLIGLPVDMADVASELADEEELTLGPQGPGGGGVGLRDVRGL